MRRLAFLVILAAPTVALAQSDPAPAEPDPASVEPAADGVVDPPAAPAEARPDDDKPAKRSKRKGKRPKVGEVVVSGYLTGLYTFRIEQNDDGQRDPDAFRLGKAVVRVEGRVSRRVGYTLEIDPRSPTIAGVLRDGYISLYLLKGHEVRLGQQKTPFGYENWQGSTELYTITRSELSEGIGRGVTHRDLGIGLGA